MEKIIQQGIEILRISNFICYAFDFLFFLSVIIGNIVDEMEAYAFGMSIIFFIFVTLLFLPIVLLMKVKKYINSKGKFLITIILNYFFNLLFINVHYYFFSIWSILPLVSVLLIFFIFNLITKIKKI